MYVRRSQLYAVAGGFAVAVVLGALVLVLLSFYEPGRRRYEAAASEYASAALVFRPSKIQSYLSSLAPGATQWIDGIPQLSAAMPRIRFDWYHAWPYEMALVLSPGAAQELNAQFVMNPLPSSPAFQREFEAVGAVRAITPIRWRGTRLSAFETNLFVINGVLTVPQWADSAGTQLPRLQLDTPANSLFAGWADNSGGALDDIVAALADAPIGASHHTLFDALLAASPAIDSIRGQGDLPNPDRLAFQGEIILADGAGASIVLAAGEMLGDAIGAFLGRVADAQLTQSWTTSPTGGVSARIEIVGFEARIRRALGRS